MPLKNAFSKLKSTIVGTQTSNIDIKLDTAVKDISSYKSQSGRNGYIDLVKSIVSKTSDVQITKGQNSMMGQALGPTSFGQGTRLLRYKTYESIISNIGYCHRALNVLVDNILSPDDITKVSISISPKTFLENEVSTESKIKTVQNSLKKIKLEEKLNIIIKSTLLFGDFFCELADPKTTLTSKSILSESLFNATMATINKNIDTLKEGKLRIKMDYSAFNENELNSEESDNSKESKLENLSMVFHEPRYVLRLQSSTFPICFGYLIFPQLNYLNGANLDQQPIDNICAQILQSLQNKIPQMKEYEKNQELKDIIGHMVKQSNQQHSMSVRYVPSDKMIHFNIPSTKYYPYGESIFDSTQYTAKVLIALETALAIQRLSRSTEKRKVGVEIGLSRDSKKEVEALKEEFRKRKVTLDSFGTIDTIPSMISTFEDVYIPQKDGKPFVDISTFNEGNVDIRSKVDELKLLRDQLVSSLGVPPAFIGIEENSVVKATLSEENILFARTIIGYQKYFTYQIVELIQKLYDIIDPENSLTFLDDLEIALPAPKSLQFEREARYTSELANLVETLERIGVPKEYSRKKYLSSIDWDEIEKYKIDADIDKTLSTDEKEDETAMSMPTGF